MSIKENIMSAITMASALVGTLNSPTIQHTYVKQTKQLIIQQLQKFYRMVKK